MFFFDVNFCTLAFYHVVFGTFLTFIAGIFRFQEPFANPLSLKDFLPCLNSFEMVLILPFSKAGVG